MTHLKQLTHLTPRLAAIALLLGAGALPAVAASSPMRMVNRRP